MTTIYKYPLILDDAQTVDLPLEAHVLTVQLQDGVPCLWALLDSEADTIPRRFVIYGTGHPMTEGAVRVYVGTFQLDWLVWHVFEEIAS